MITAANVQAGSNRPRSVPALDVERIRADFPILRERIGGRPVVYLDNAATAQKPQQVIDAVSAYYARDNANVHRGVHTLSVRATRAFEEARVKIQRFIAAPRPEQIIFTRGTTEAVNLVAQSYGRTRIREGDEIVISWMEHHSNIVPWQILCQQTGAVLRVAPINDRGELLIDEFVRLLAPRTKLVAITHMSNALGTINPVREIVDLAHAREIPVLVDGAQAVPHFPVNVQELDCDFYAFSGHKMFGPTGIGVLYGRLEILEGLPPYQGGGDMIKSVSFAGTTYNDLPYRLEAGTPHIAGAIGLGAAVDYLNAVGLDNVAVHEEELLFHATELVSQIPQVRLIGTAPNKAGVLSFVIGDVHAHDVGTILDHVGIAVRTGHHCSQPVMERFKVPATTRASFALYNTKEEADALAEGLREVVRVFC